MQASKPQQVQKRPGRYSDRRIAAVVLAAGSGSRVGGSLPKQFRAVGGRPMVAHALQAFGRHPAISRCVLVLGKQHFPLFDRLVGPSLGTDVETVTGGSNRSASVANALEHLAQDSITHVLVHDGARPLVSSRLISSVVDRLAVENAVIPALPVADALWRLQNGSLRKAVRRDGLVRAQTPQGFAFRQLLEAFRTRNGGADDCAAIAAGHGMAVTIVAGETRNFKITHQADLRRANDTLAQRFETRIGHGVDAHRCCPGTGVVLCGVKISGQFSLQGHSDADVGLHALCDALYGAMGDGDIGAWFPPTDSEWQGADSTIFLHHAASRVADRGFAVVNIDITLICEEPKIRPHASAMRSVIAKVLNTSVARINVKATTTEGMGFAGRREGIAAHATAVVRGPCQN